MTPSQNRAAAAAIAAAIAIPAEGLRQFAYKDPVGILTVCYGHTGDVRKGDRRTLEECNNLLTEDMRQAIEIVDKCQPGLPENVLAAFGDAVFNAGQKIVCDKSGSTAARMLAAKQYVQACQQLPRWNKARIAGQLVELPGLTKRRNREMQVCMSGMLG